MELYIVLAITLFMVVSFIFQKVPFGVTTMACCALMVLTGVMTVPEAFSGFCNQTVVLIAPMLALSAALTKTSLVAKIRSAMDLMKGKRGFLLILFFYIIGAAFVQFIPATATISILIVFLSTLGNTGEITPKRLLLPLLGILCIWKSKLPIGMAQPFSPGTTPCMKESFPTKNTPFRCWIRSSSPWFPWRCSPCTACLPGDFSRKGTIRKSTGAR